MFEMSRLKSLSIFPRFYYRRDLSFLRYPTLAQWYLNSVLRNRKGSTSQFQGLCGDQKTHSTHRPTYDLWLHVVLATSGKSNHRNIIQGQSNVHVRDFYSIDHVRIRGIIKHLKQALIQHVARLGSSPWLLLEALGKLVYSSASFLFCVSAVTYVFSVHIALWCGRVHDLQGMVWTPEWCRFVWTRTF